MNLFQSQFEINCSKVLQLDSMVLAADVKAVPLLDLIRRGGVAMADVGNVLMFGDDPMVGQFWIYRYLRV